VSPDRAPYPDREAVADACLAAIVAPAAAIVALGAAGALLGDSLGALLLALIILFVAIPIAAAHVLLLGLPAYLLLRKVVAPGPPVAALAGALLGIGPIFLFGGDFVWFAWNGRAGACGLFAALGLIGGVAFARRLARHEKGGPSPDRPLRPVPRA
jgi:hypothetical protein